MNSWGKIAVACRIGQKPDGEFFRCWTRLMLGGLRDGDRVLTPAIEMPCHYAADCLAKGFLNTDADTLLFIDDDMVFNNKNLNMLRDDEDGLQYDVIMGLCQSRKPPHRPLILEPNPNGAGFLVPSAPPEDKIVDVGVVGLGFTLIRRKVFEAMEEPYFYWGEKGDGEDAMFSMAATKLGFKLGVNTRVVIGHRFPVTVEWDFKENGLAYESNGRANK